MHATPKANVQVLTFSHVPWALGWIRNRARRPAQCCEAGWAPRKASLLMLIYKYLTIINFYSISIPPNYQSNLYHNSIYIYYSNLLSPLHLLSNTTYSINLILKYTLYLLPLSSSKFYSSECLT